MIKLAQANYGYFHLVGKTIIDALKDLDKIKANIDSMR